jgi:hypothetical protein
MESGSQTVGAFRSTQRALSNMRKYSDYLDRDRRQYWRDWQLEVRENQCLRRAMNEERSNAQTAKVKAHRAESQRRNLSRSLLRMSLTNERQSNLCPKCMVGQEYILRSNQALRELCDALRQQVASDSTRRTELKEAFRQRLSQDDRKRHMLESENASLYERIDALQESVRELKDKMRHSCELQSFPVCLLSSQEKVERSSQSHTRHSQDASTETHVYVAKLWRKNRRPQRSGDSLHRCRE